MHKIIDNHLFFYSNKTPFSQWTRYNMFEEGITYNSCECYMMYKKAVLFGDHEVAHKILNSLYASEQKELGRAVMNFNNDVWLQHREQIVYQANLLKFTQYKHLTDFILDTGDLVIVESSPYDRIWGIGFDVDDSDPKNQSQWGLNLLGKALMRVRATIKYGKQTLNE